MSSEIISTVFRILNFGVACGVGAYVFKKNLLPGIKEGIAAQRAAIQDMAHNNQELLDKKNTVEREIDEQEELGKKLYDQIKLWSFSFEKEVSRSDAEREILNQQIEKRAREQADNKLLMQVQAQVLEQALAGAREELLAHFASEQEGKKFIASIVARMREGTR